MLNDLFNDPIILDVPVFRPRFKFKLRLRLRLREVLGPGPGSAEGQEWERVGVGGGAGAGKRGLGEDEEGDIVDVDASMKVESEGGVFVQGFVGIVVELAGIECWMDVVRPNSCKYVCMYGRVVVGDTLSPRLDSACSVMSWR